MAVSFFVSRRPRFIAWYQCAHILTPFTIKSLELSKSIFAQLFYSLWFQNCFTAIKKPQSLAYHLNVSVFRAHTILARVRMLVLDFGQQFTRALFDTTSSSQNCQKEVCRWEWTNPNFGFKNKKNCLWNKITVFSKLKDLSCPFLTESLRWKTILE